MLEPLGADTDRRFGESLIERGLATRAAVEGLARAARGGRETLARLSVEAGIVDAAGAAAIVAAVRAGALGPYVLLGELGRGGMGVVHRARHEPTGAIRALKVLTGTSDVEALVRFRREAEALARVGGDAVVPVHDLGIARGRLYFAMALMSGGSLRARLEARGPLPWRAAVALGVELASALERCHAAGLIHRDLKPDNVLFDEQGRARLADFGIARDETAPSLTETGAVLGTLAYMPPEQLRGARVDARADVYALGAILHEALAGTRPFQGQSEHELFLAKTAGTRTPLPATVPPALAAVVARALAPDPDARPRTARELAEALATVTPRARRSWWWLALLAPALGLLALPGRSPPPPAPPPPPRPGPPPALQAPGRRPVVEAARILRANGPCAEAHALVLTAREPCTEQDRATFAAAAQERFARIVRSGTMSLDPARVEAVTRDAEAIVGAAEHLGVPVEVPGILGIAFLGCGGNRKNAGDWPGALAAARLAVLADSVSARGESLTWSVKYLEEKLGPPEPALAIVDAAIRVRPDELRVRARRVQLLCLAGLWDEALRATLELSRARPLPGEVTFDLAHHLENFPPEAADRALLDALVATGAAPFFTLLRVRSVPERREELVDALAAGFQRSKDVAEAVAILAREPEHVPRRAAALVKRAPARIAAQLLVATGDPKLHPFARRALAAETDEDRRALARELEAYQVGR